MVTRVQRRWRNPEFDRLGRRISLRDKLQESLDDDEMIIFPHMLEEFPDLFESVRGRAYLIREAGNPDAALDWCWQDQVDRIQQYSGPVDILNEQLVVRLSLPWNGSETDFFISEEEYNESPTEYEVIDILVRARDTLTGYYGPVDKADFEQCRDRYTDESVEYLVRWKPAGDVEFILSE